MMMINSFVIWQRTKKCREMTSTSYHLSMASFRSSGTLRNHRTHPLSDSHQARDCKSSNNMQVINTDRKHLQASRPDRSSPPDLQDQRNPETHRHTTSDHNRHAHAHLFRSETRRDETDQNSRRPFESRNTSES